MPYRRVKTYVELDTRVDERGVVTPKLITMPDGGRYPVDTVVGTSERMRHGRQVTDHAVLVRGRETHLFREDDRFYVEAKVAGEPSGPQRFEDDWIGEGAGL